MSLSLLCYYKSGTSTGFTVILPNRGNVFLKRVVGSCFILNRAGEVSGLTQINEWGLIETPILLTNTLSVGTCSSATVEYLVGKYPGIGMEHDVVIPVVGECDASWLHGAARRHVKAKRVFQANKIPRETRKMVYRMKVLLDRCIDPLYRGVMEATEEAILNALCAAEAMEGHSGHSAPALPLDRIRGIMERWKASAGDKTEGSS